MGINVPNVPGVPALSSYSAASGLLLTADVANLLNRVLRPQWGIYLNGAPIIATSVAPLIGLGSLVNAFSALASLGNSVSNLFGGGLGTNFGLTTNTFSVVDFAYKQDWAIADYQVEGGGFQSYDKVQLPFDVRMRVAAGGTSSNRQSLLDEIDAIANTLFLFDVYTPEKIYQSCSIAHYDYKRSANSGVGIIVADMWLQQIRVSSTAQYQNTQQPTVAGTVGTGNSSAQAVPPGLSGVAAQVT